MHTTAHSRVRLFGGQVLVDVADSQFLEGGLTLGGESTLRSDGVEEWLLGIADVSEVFGLEVGDVTGGDSVQVTSDTTEDARDLLSDIHRRVLGLLEELGKSNTTVEELLGGGIHIGTELGEGGDLTVLGKIELHGTGDLFHGLELGSGTDSGDGKTDVDSWSNTLVEELGLQEDLTVGNRNDIGGNISGHITSLGLNDWKSGQRTGTLVVAHLGSSLQETAMEVEDITGVGLTSWRSSEKQRHLSVGNGLLREIVVHDEGVLGVVTEPLAHGATRVWREVLEWGGVSSGGDDDDGVLHGIGLLEDVTELADGGLLLADGDVDAVEFLVVIVVVEELLLVKDGVECDGGLTGLPVTDDQLTLASADGDERVDGLKTRLHRLVDRFTGNNTRGLDVDTSSLLAVDWALAVKGVTEWVDNSSEKLGSDWHIDDSTGPLDDIAFLDVTIVTEDDNTDVVGLQVQRHTLDTAVELDHLFGLDVLETVDTSDTITDSEYLTGFCEVDLGGLAEDSLLEEAGELSGALLGVGHLSRGGERAGSDASRRADDLTEHLGGFCLRGAPL